jgi:hypothetical protein
MHLIRNSMDHGIEPADVRAASGKSLTATIRLAARHSGASVLVTVTDDGRGIDADAVRRRAVERGLISAEAQLTESQTLCAAFRAGIFDRQASHRCFRPRRGHGCGPPAGGEPARRGRSPEQAGAGHSVTLRLPLTMAIIDGLLVGVGDACFVLPLSITLECIELTRQDIARANGKHIANVRGELVPYIRLREHFHERSRASRSSRSCWSKPAKAGSDLSWTRCWAIARRSSKAWGGFTARFRWFQGHHSGQRNRGPDSGSRTSDSGRYARRGARQRRPHVDGAGRPLRKTVWIFEPSRAEAALGPSASAQV